MSGEDKKAPPEILAFNATYTALKDLDQQMQRKVLRLVSEMLSLSGNNEPERDAGFDDPSEGSAANHARANESESHTEESAPEDTDGINAAALKWMRRNGFTRTVLENYFSLGIEEIDLVAEDVGGNSMREKMHNVLLLKAIAAFLSTGVARVSFEQLKEACLHYDAYDAPNFAKSLKVFAPEITGSKATGFTLTPRGMTAAKDLLKSLTSAPIA